VYANISSLTYHYKVCLSSGINFVALFCTRSSLTTYGRRVVDVCSGRLHLTSLGRLEFTVLRREYVGVRRRRDECMTSWRRL